MNALLEARNISVCYGKVEAVKSVSLVVPKGAIVGLIGHNGAGKSTLLSAIAGVAETGSGSIVLDGKTLSRSEWGGIVRNGLSYVPQGRGVFTDLTVMENLTLGLRAATGLGIDSATGQERLADVLSWVPPLRDLLDRKAGQLSGGQQGLVSIGRGLIANPRILLLDEPSTGLAPIMVKEVLAVIHRLRERGATSVVLVEQNIPQVLDIADQVYVLKAGTLAASGEPASFRDASRIMELF